MNKNIEDEKRKTRQVSIWLSEEEYLNLKKKSQEFGLSQTGYMRKCINENICFLDNNMKKLTELFALIQVNKK